MPYSLSTKHQALKAAGTFNPRADQVAHTLFQQSDFFDPHDGEGKWKCQQVPREQWRFLKREAHPGYISWEQFLANQDRLLQNHQARGGAERLAGPPREGPALLQGLVLCGKCGRSMTVRYHYRSGRPSPDYLCQNDSVEQGKPVCQHVPG